MSNPQPFTDIASLTDLVRETSLEAAVWFGKQLECKQNGVFSSTTTAPVGSEVVYGFFNRELDFVPVSTMMIGTGTRSKNRNTLTPIKPECVRQYVGQTFAFNKVWNIRESRVKTDDFIFPISQFLAKYKDEVEVFAGIHENEHRHTSVLCFVIMLKRARGQNRLMWEISIDDGDLDEMGSHQSVFR